MYITKKIFYHIILKNRVKNQIIYCRLNLVLKMNIMNKILLKSNSYNYYKTNYEKLKDENKNLKNQMKKLNEKYNRTLQKNDSQHKKRNGKLDCTT